MRKTVPVNKIRPAVAPDLEAIRIIFNQGIEDRIATLEELSKTSDEINDWWTAHGDRFAVVVAEDELGDVIGWASLNLYSHRCAYRGVADLSVYVARQSRGRGVGFALLGDLERRAKKSEFHKIVLFALASHVRGRALYTKCGYYDVGVFREQGMLDGKRIDIVAMEKILRPFVLFVCRHNTGRSQMAEAFLRESLGNTVDVASAGTIAAERADPGVVAIMAEVGIDITAARPKLITPEMTAQADRIITMGCDVEVSRVDDDWGLPDPKGQSVERLREIREMIRAKANVLADALNQ